MKIIQSIADIEALKAIGEIPLALIKEVEREFILVIESENEDVEIHKFRLPLKQALFVLEKGDDVFEKLNHPLELEYVEQTKLAELSYYRCAIRNDHEFQFYYSIVGTHETDIEEWLQEQSQKGS